MHPRDASALTPDSGDKSTGGWSLVIIAVTAAALAPFTGGISILVTLALLVALAVQRRWRQVLVVLAACAVVGLLWFLLTDVVSGGGEFEISPADPDLSPQ